MIPDFVKIKHGVWEVLPPGIHPATFAELEARFATTKHRRELFEGFKAGCKLLAEAGCTAVYIDGSYITNKDIPGDFDACWDEAAVDFNTLDTTLWTFDNKRAAQKAKFKGEFFPQTAQAVANPPLNFLSFFQRDRNSPTPKGIVKLDPRELL